MYETLLLYSNLVEKPLKQLQQINLLSCSVVDLQCLSSVMVPRENIVYLKHYELFQESKWNRLSKVTTKVSAKDK